MSHILHFSLGPVQGFIGQARRTRDYWAGSFLLSYLAGHAMYALRKEGCGEVEFPVVEGDPLYTAIVGSEGGTKPCACTQTIGTLPNRFKAKISKPELFRPHGDDPCTKAVRAAWKKIADAVWQQFVDFASDRGKNTRAIWDQQINGFWETSWVLGVPRKDEGGKTEDDGAWLDRRKNWRSQARMSEPGDHCRMMSEYQELSGYVRAHGPDMRQRQEKFWDAVRGRVAQVIDRQGPCHAVDKADYELLELPRTERLCAIALVKRLFPILPESKLRSAIGWMPDGSQRRQRSDQRDDPLGRIRYWPSTAYMAAVPWAKRAWYDLDETACTRFADYCCKEVYVEAVAERESRVASLAGKPDLEAEDDPLQRFGALGGELFFADMLETDRRNAQREHATADDQHVIKRAAREVSRKEKALTALKKLLDELETARKRRALAEPTFRQAKFTEASPFYALLLMDGDKAGELIRDLGGEPVSKALSTFTRIVQRVVRKHDGVLIYAGGDDVKAFLPLTAAVPCVIDLHCAYLAAFASKRKVPDLKGNKPTISAGLVFAHHNVPLTSVIREAHHQLNDVAKDGNGRNSLAIAVLKPSGKAMEWVARFAHDQHGQTEAKDNPIGALMPLAEAYAGDAERSTSFLYNLKDRYEGVILPQEGEPLLRPDDDKARIEKIMLAEWLKGSNVERLHEQNKLEAEEQRVRELLAVCLTKDAKDQTRFRLDGGLIARFLADNGVGVDLPPRGRGEAGR